MASDEVSQLLGQFAADAGRVLPLAALWAHGSLAYGDFVPGRSDLDLVALVGAPVTDEQRQDLRAPHEALIAREPLAAGLHCSYMVSGEHADPGRHHLTWAHQEMFERPVSPVSRRELHAGGLGLLGPAPARRCSPRSPTPSWPPSSAPTCATTGCRIPPGRTCGDATSGSTSGC